MVLGIGKWKKLEVDQFITQTIMVHSKELEI